MIKVAVTWKMTDEQLARIKQCAEDLNERNAHVKMVPNIQDDVLLSVSVRFLPPRSWSVVTPENAQLERWIYGRIEKYSHYRLFPDRNELFRKGILELKYNSVHRLADDRYVTEAMTFIAENLIDVMINDKEAS